MLLMIDNYDSFTYNLVQYFYEMNQDVEVYRNDEISINEIKSDISFLKTTLEDGAMQATERARKTIDDVNKLMGFSID